MSNISEFSALQVLYLTTTGRTSGQPRMIEIWFVAHQDSLYVLAEHNHQTNWVKNIEVNPLVRVRIADQDLDVRAKILDPRRDADLWRTVQALAREKYGWGEGLPVQLTPV